MTVTAVQREPADATRRAKAGSLRARIAPTWAYEALYAASVLLAVALILSIVGRRAGWPLGEEFYNELILVRLYAAHFRHLDLFPAWSSSDGLGLGTPVLLYYQKAFFYVSGLLFILLGGALKPTLVISIGIFLIVGAYGMRQALRLITDSRLLVTVGSIGFLFTNYVFTDWLARGDLPEFSAVMVVPWLLYWCLDLIKNRHVSLSLIVILPLLAFAHSAIALISLFALATASVIFLASAGIEGLRKVGPRLLVVIGATVLLLAPTLLAEVRFSDAYDPASKVTHFTSISQELVSFGSYFFIGSYPWLSNEARLNLQMDYALWIPIALSLVALGVYWALVPPASRRVRISAYLHGPSMAFLLVTAAIYLFLQLRAALFVYDVLTPLRSIDYPYRMMAFITPIAVVLVVAIAHLLLKAFRPRLVVAAVSVAWLASLVLLSPLTSTWTTHYGILAGPGQFPSVNLGSPPAMIDYATYKGLFSPHGILFDEYLPRVFTDHQELYDDGSLYAAIHDHDHGGASLTGATCRLQVPSHSPFESLELSFTVTCDRATEFALPVTHNSYSTVYRRGPNGRLTPIAYRHLASDPRLVVPVGASTPETFVVHLPTLWGILG